ncbi:MAG TPA: NAD-dependent epimerase/dehydratase family protein, partial [Bacteroidia bacterium]|nr:NAD-dependent epimerase/dehydratase family protein [Bacteroidia bacterium]
MGTKENALILGAAGQIGTDLVAHLRKSLGSDHVLATDIKEQQGEVKSGGRFSTLDVLDFNAVHQTIKDNNITQVYLLAALLSATAEQKVQSAWRLNMNGLLGLLEIARENKGLKIFWPSSIAVFGPTTPKENTPQITAMEPNTVYGISKQAGERWCEYYHQKFGVDVRSLRYPGLISYKAHPGGGTTDYAVEIFFEALKNKKYSCYLKEDTRMPMMYMPDAVKATWMIMNAPASDIKIRSSYNIHGMSFTPEEISNEIKKSIP